MKHTYIEDLYRRGRDQEGRRAIAAEIVRENTGEDEPPTYQPSEAEIDARETEYYAARRAHQYGSADRQVEHIAEHGLAAWQSQVAAIKAAIPKPE